MEKYNWKRFGMPIILVVVLALIVGGIAYGQTTTTSMPVHRSGDDGLFVKVCCIDELNFWYGGYFNLPIEVEVWNKDLKPMPRADTYVRITGDDGSELFNATMKTNRNGIARFGPSFAHGSFSPRILLIDVKVNYKNNGIDIWQYYDKEITVVQD